MWNSSLKVTSLSGCRDLWRQEIHGVLFYVNVMVTLELVSWNFAEMHPARLQVMCMWPNHTGSDQSVSYEGSTGSCGRGVGVMTVAAPKGQRRCCYSISDIWSGEHFFIERGAKKCTDGFFSLWLFIRQASARVHMVCWSDWLKLARDRRWSSNHLASFCF